jgi:hypothetical protein
MELLESVGPRPRQARYQAALRPDMIDFLILAYFANLWPRFTLWIVPPVGTPGGLS